jgi:hypothetical protein
MSRTAYQGGRQGARSAEEQRASSVPAWRLGPGGWDKASLDVTAMVQQPGIESELPILSFVAHTRWLRIIATNFSIGILSLTPA